MLSPHVNKGDNGAHNLTQPDFTSPNLHFMSLHLKKSIPENVHTGRSFAEGHC